MPRLRIMLVDWDGDGRLDVIANQTRIRPGVYLSDGDWSAAAAEVVAARTVVGSPEGLSTQPCVVDWDGDGRLDLVVAEFRFQGDGKAAVSEVAWHRNLSAAGVPRLAGPHRLMTLPEDEFVDGLSAGDWDGDGWPDLIVGYHRGKYDKARGAFEASGVRVYLRRLQTPHDGPRASEKSATPGV